MCIWGSAGTAWHWLRLDSEDAEKVGQLKSRAIHQLSYHVPFSEEPRKSIGRPDTDKVEMICAPSECSEGMLLLALEKGCTWGDLNQVS